MQCNAKQYTEACNELIKGVNSVMKITQGLTVTESMQETLLQDFYKAKGVSDVEGFDNKELEELGKSIIIASIVP